MHDRCGVTVFIPIFFQPDEGHWLTKSGLAALRAFVREKVEWKLFSDVVVASDNDSILKAVQDVGAQGIHASPMVDFSNCLLSAGGAECLKQGVVDLPQSDVMVLMDFRMQGIGHDRVSQALDVYARNQMPVYGMVATSDHPCQMNFCETLVDVGALHRLDHAHANGVAGHVATVEFPLTPGLFSDIPPSGAMATVECDPRLATFSLRPVAVPTGERLIWQMTGEGRARLLIPEERLSNISGPPVVGVAMSEHLDVLCGLVTTPGGEALQLLASESPDAFVLAWARGGKEKARQLYRASDGTIDFSAMPASPVYDFAIYQPAVDTRADWVRPISENNELWYKDPNSARIRRKEDDTIIFGRQSFPSVHVPGGLTIFSQEQAGNLVEILRAGNGVFFEIPEQETALVATVVDFLKTLHKKEDEGETP